jgi:type I restriction enzyme M protein
VKSGAGQYFTPRPLIQRDRRCHGAPKPGEMICDPACGTGGFLLAAHDYVAEALAQQDCRRRVEATARGKLHGLRSMELADSPGCAAMNLVLHGMGEPGVRADRGGCATRWRHDPGERYDVVLTNPPFGKKSQHHHRGRGGQGQQGERHRRIATTSGPPPRTSSSTSCST